MQDVCFREERQKNFQFRHIHFSVLSERMSAYQLDCPATNVEIAVLMQAILLRATDLEERVTLRFGTCVLLARDEREREEHRDTVTTREALITLTAAMIPVETVARMRISK